MSMTSTELGYDSKIEGDVIVSMSKGRTLDLKAIGRIHHRFSVGDPEKEILRMSGGISSSIILVGVPSKEDDDFGARHIYTPDRVASLLKKAPCSLFAIKAIDEVFVVV